MEVGAGVRKADRRAVLLHVGQDQDVGVLGVMELVDDVRLGPAELARELEKLRRLSLRFLKTRICPAKNASQTFRKSGLIASASSPKPPSSVSRIRAPREAASCARRRAAGPTAPPRRPRGRTARRRGAGGAPAAGPPPTPKGPRGRLGPPRITLPAF